ncbi:hypothetical protein ACLKA6_018431 [Drosophila palustris]
MIATLTLAYQTRPDTRPTPRTHNSSVSQQFSSGSSTGVPPGCQLQKGDAAQWASISSSTSSMRFAISHKSFQGSGRRRRRLLRLSVKEADGGGGRKEACPGAAIAALMPIHGIELV